MNTENSYSKETVSPNTREIVVKENLIVAAKDVIIEPITLFTRSLPIVVPPHSFSIRHMAFPLEIVADPAVR